MVFLSKYIKGINRNQIFLLPPSVDDFIDENNEVRVIDAFINSLDLLSLGFKNSMPNHFGTPSYDPRDLLKIFVYCYPKKIRSSRKIAAEVKRNLELIWLVGGISPDFRTLSDFRKDNIDSIKLILKQFNTLCLELDVFSRELCSLDGSKFKAVNSKDNNFTKDKLLDRIERLNKKVDEYMILLESNDNDDSFLRDNKSDIQDKLQKAKAKTIEYNQLLKSLADSSSNQLSLTDKDSRLMKCNNNMLVGFNAQMNVDTKSHIVTALAVSNKPNDNGCMCDMGSLAKDSFDVDLVEQLADGGYVDQEDIKQCFENKIVPILPDGKYEISWDYKDHAITDEIKKGSTCDDVKTCLESGIIPDCYSSLDMDIKVVDTPLEVNLSAITDETDEALLINKAKEGFFVRDKVKNVVYCPSGGQLTFKRKKQKNDIFIGNSQCMNCKKKCTKFLVKELELHPNQDILACKVYRTKVPKNIVVLNIKKVVITYRPDKEKYKLRKNTSEHPFGTLKRAHDASYFLLKGLDKVEGELALSVLGYNINRLIKIVGVKTLIEHLKSRNASSVSPDFRNIKSIYASNCIKSTICAFLFCFI